MKVTGAKQSIGNTKYGILKEVELAFDETVERTKKALASEGFGVLSEIRMDEKFKEKLGIDFRKYVILGACNPPLAYRTVQEDLNIGRLLPCNVVVYEADESGTSVVAAIDAGVMMSVVGDTPEITETANEVTDKLRRSLEAL